MGVEVEKERLAGWMQRGHFGKWSCCPLWNLERWSLIGRQQQHHLLVVESRERERERVGRKEKKGKFAVCSYSVDGAVVVAFGYVHFVEEWSGWSLRRGW